MTLVAIVAAFLFFVLRAKERERRLRGRDKGFGYYLLVAFLDFLRAFLLVMIFYHALLLFVYAGSDWVSTTRLVRLEESLRRLESYGKVAKLSAPITLGLLLALYVFGLCRFVPELKAYKKLVKQLYQI